jgi:hypothetical protein
VLVVTLTGLTLSAPTPASADSGWKCGSVDNHLMDGTMCIRTFRKDGYHISGADVLISHSVYSPVCLYMTLSHAVQLGNGERLNGSWGDYGAFLSCPGQDHSYHWTHAGAGAWIGDGWNVVGLARMWLNPTPTWMPEDGRAVTPRVWWPNH